LRFSGPPAPCIRACSRRLWGIAWCPVKLIKVAAAILNQTPLDWAGNRERILRAIAEAKAQEVGILCLPELCITGYGCEDAFHSPGVQAAAARILLEVAPACRGMVVAIGLPLFYHRALYNV